MASGPDHQALAPVVPVGPVPATDRMNGMDGTDRGNDLNSLERQLDELIGICQRLREENVALKAQQTNLLTERAQLIERSELARSRVEAMIARLKAMETG